MVEQMQDQEGPRTFKVPEQNWSLLQEKFAKLARKAEKLGFEQPRLEVLETVQEKKPIHSDFWLSPGLRVEVDKPFLLGYRIQKYIICVVHGEPPVIDGWQFVASITPVVSDKGEKSKHVGNFLLKKVFDVLLPEEYRTVGNKCDHCGHRRYRKKTYIIRNMETNEFMQVGSTCLGAFFVNSGNNPESVASYSEWLIEIDELASEAEEDSWSGGSRLEYQAELQTFMEWTAFFVRRVGWVPKSKADDLQGITATCGEVWRILFPFDDKVIKHHKDRFKHEDYSPNEMDKSWGKKAIAWLDTLVAKGSACNEFEWNMSMLRQQGYVNYKVAGFAAAAVSCVQRAEAKEAEANVKLRVRGQKKASEYFGTVGEKVERPMTIVGRQSFDSDYGVRVLIRFVDDEGNVAVWWTSVSASSNCEWEHIGMKYVVRGTVKEHKLYTPNGSTVGIRQTVLSRCSVVGDIRDQEASMTGDRVDNWMYQTVVTPDGKYGMVHRILRSNRKPGEELPPDYVDMGDIAFVNRGTVGCGDMYKSEGYPVKELRILPRQRKKTGTTILDDTGCPVPEGFKPFKDKK